MKGEILILLFLTDYLGAGKTGVTLRVSVSRRYIRLETLGIISVNRMRLSVGCQMGIIASPFIEVICRTLLPSAFIVKTWDQVVPEGTNPNAILEPSGEYAGDDNVRPLVKSVSLTTSDPSVFAEKIWRLRGAGSTSVSQLM